MLHRRARRRKFRRSHIFVKLGRGRAGDSGRPKAGLALRPGLRAPLRSSTAETLAGKKARKCTI
jgi:hypothetical protein